MPGGKVIVTWRARREKGREQEEPPQAGSPAPWTGVITLLATESPQRGHAHTTSAPRADTHSVWIDPTGKPGEVWVALCDNIGGVPFETKLTLPNPQDPIPAVEAAVAAGMSGYTLEHMIPGTGRWPVQTPPNQELHKQLRLLHGGYCPRGSGGQPGWRACFVGVLQPPLEIPPDPRSNKGNPAQSSIITDTNWWISSRGSSGSFMEVLGAKGLRLGREPKLAVVFTKAALDEANLKLFQLAWNKRVRRKWNAIYEIVNHMPG